MLSLCSELCHSCSDSVVIPVSGWKMGLQLKAQLDKEQRNDCPIWATLCFKLEHTTLSASLPNPWTVSNSFMLGKMKFTLSNKINIQKGFFILKGGLYLVPAGSRDIFVLTGIVLKQVLTKMANCSFKHQTTVCEPAKLIHITDELISAISPLSKKKKQTRRPDIATNMRKIRADFFWLY